MVALIEAGGPVYLPKLPRRLLPRAWASALRATRCVVTASFALLGLGAAAQPLATPEEVEAAYLHKIVAFVDWAPTTFATPTSPIVIGVAGSDRIYDLLAAIAAGRPVQGRPVEVRRLPAGAVASNVQLVFIGADAWSELPKWAAAAASKGVVVATDAPNGTDKGAALAFVREESRVRFEVSLSAADKAGVKFSSRLLNVAAHVIGSGQ